MNFIFYAMEIKFIITGKLNMIASGDISAVELETAFAISMFVLGFVGEVSWVDTTVGAALGLAPDSKCPIHVFGKYTWRFYISCFLMSLIVLNIWDSVVDSLKHDWKKFLYLYSPVLACLGLYFALSTLPCYAEQRGLIMLLVNYSTAVMSLNLMLHNMTGKPFSPLQPMILFPLAPVVAYYMGVTG